VSTVGMATLEAELKTKSAEVERLEAAAKKVTAEKKAKEEEIKTFSPDSPDVKKMQERMKRQYAAKQKLKLDEKVAVLRKRLGLTDAQAASVRELLEKNPVGVQSIIARSMAGEQVDEKDSMLAMLRPGKKDAELTAKITELLTPEQQEVYTTVRQEQRANDVEVKANKELARLQSSLTLSPEQKDKAFATLTKLADEEYDNPVNHMAAMMQQQMKAMPKHASAEIEPHMEEINTAATFAAERRKLRVDAMRDVLSPEQLALYETQQKQSSMAEMMEGTFDDMPGGLFMGGMEDEVEETTETNAPPERPKPPTPVR
jgi:hypothetical protein